MNERIKEVIKFPLSSQLCINCKKGSWGGSYYIPKYFKGRVSLGKVIDEGFNWGYSVQGDAYWYIYCRRETIPDRSLWGMSRDELGLFASGL